MTEQSAIEWTDDTWNPWHGCFHVSPGCEKCYMFRDKKKYGQEPNDIRRSKTTFGDPLKWARKPEKHGQFIFTCSWSDFFIKQADPWRDEAWDVIRQTPQLCYLILTKRPQRIAKCLPDDWDNGWNNVWLGTSVESQPFAHRITTLVENPAARYFVSYEPAIGQLYPNLVSGWEKIDWLIAGGESDWRPRLPQANWFRIVRDECRLNGTDFFFKQWGGKPNEKFGGEKAVLDGRRWHDRPHFKPEKPAEQMNLF